MSAADAPATIPPSAREILDGPEYATLATLDADGLPHLSVVWVARDGDDVLVSTVKGRRKHRNLERDPRACVAISKPVTMAHVIVWGTIEIRVDDEAQRLWEAMITGAFGPDGLGKRSRTLSRDGTMLGVLTPLRHRIYGLEPRA